MKIEEILNVAQKITRTNYNASIDELQTIDVLRAALEDVINEYNHLSNEFNDFKSNVEERYELKKGNYYEYGE